MSRYNHPLTAEPREARDQDQTVTFEDVDVEVKVSPDGKRVQLTVTHQNGEDSTFRLGGFTLNTVPMRPDRRVSLYGVDAVIEWQDGGLGMYPGVNVKVTRDLGGEN